MNRIFYLFITFIIIIVGLASRRYTRVSESDFEGFALSQFIRHYAGDALWAAMVYFGFRMIFIHWSKKRVAILALLFSYTIEFTQLIQQDWLNAIRQTTLGGLILGFGFLWSDLWMYAIGIIVAFGIDFYGFKTRINAF